MKNNATKIPPDTPSEGGICSKNFSISYNVDSILNFFNSKPQYLKMSTFFDAKIEIIEINKYQERLRFSGKYPLVKFLLLSAGINSFEINILG